MDTKELIERVRERSLSRREFKQALAGLGIGIAAVPMMRRPARAEGEVMYFGWAGYETPYGMSYRWLRSSLTPYPSSKLLPSGPDC